MIFHDFNLKVANPDIFRRSFLLPRQSSSSQTGTSSFASGLPVANARGSSRRSWAASLSSCQNKRNRSNLLPICQKWCFRGQGSWQWHVSFYDQWQAPGSGLLHLSGLAGSTFQDTAGVRLGDGGTVRCDLCCSRLLERSAASLVLEDTFDPLGDLAFP